jgi:uncharacterized protein YndB with AHSA1/START domain
MNPQAVAVQRIVRVPAAAAYRAFIRPVALREWMCDGATCFARSGGHFHFWWNSGYYASGEYVALKENDEVVCTWHGRGEPGPTRVRVALTPVEGGTEVTVEHTGFGEGDAWAAARGESKDGWTAGLENLQSVLETGLDLRIVRRPMMGINIGEYSADIAAKLGVSVAEGIRLSGVIEGMGAQAAGLRTDDVIVSIGGHATTDWPSIVNALQKRHAGETVDVVFYRGSEKRTVAMTLSPRPMPTVPPTREGLAEVLQQMYASLQAEVAACFEGVSDGEATFHPAPGEWSAVETVAHLIAGERENQAWIADLINDDERWPDRFENPTAVPARITATAGQYPTPQAILEELRHSHAEVVAMIAALPDDLLGRKGSYWRLGRDLQQAPDHVREHIGQIRAAIEAARR